MATASPIVLIAFACMCAQGIRAQQQLPVTIMSAGSHTARVPVPHRPFLLMDDRSLPIDPARIPSPYSYQHLGIFCKVEVKMNGWLPIPVMVRLGDVQHAEELDGKGVFRGLH